MKPYFQAGDCTLYHGDCREIIGAIQFDAIIADPPYGISFCHGGNNRAGIGGGMYATKFNGKKVIGDDEAFDPSFLLCFDCPICLWGGNHFANRLPAYPSWLVWDKRCASNHSNDFADCEIAWTNGGGVARVFRHHWDGMMKASERGEDRMHPTQKPVALMTWTMEQCRIPEGATILDPYCGSASTGIACIRTGRKFIGIEIDEAHCETAAKRIERELAQGVFQF